MQCPFTIKVTVILPPIFRDRVKLSRGGSLANQMSQFVFMFTNFAYKTPRLIFCGILGMGLFKVFI
jgi:hypothetical protein